MLSGPVLAVGVFMAGLASAPAEPKVDLIRVARGAMVGVSAPNGRWHAFDDPKAGGLIYDVQRRRAAHRLGATAGASGCTSYAWSADSQKVAFVIDPRGDNVAQDHRVAVYDLSTRRKRIATTANACTFAFDDAGGLLWATWVGEAAERRAVVRRGLNPEPLVAADPGRLGRWLLGPPDRTVRSRPYPAVAYFVEGSGGITERVGCADLESRRVHDVTDQFGGRPRSLRVDPRGRLCGFVETNVVCMVPGATRAEVIETGVRQPGWPGTEEATPFSPDGASMVWKDGLTQAIWAWSRGGTPRRVTANRGGYRSAVFADDDHVWLSDPLTVQPVLEVPLRGGSPRTVSPEAAEWTGPTFAGDTALIGRERGGTRDLWLLAPRRGAR